MVLRVYNARTKQKIEYQPVRPGRATVYICGMTVQGPPHVGHLRAAVVADLVRRWLGHRGLEVTLVHNYTDIDDKIIERAQEEGVTPQVIAERNIAAYEAAIAQLNVSPPTISPKASEHMTEIVELIEALVDKGHAYPTERGDVLFDVRSYADYGELSGRRLEELRAGARIEVDEEKRHAEDFALWKAAKPGEPSWPSPWSAGRPGWHIECSAMAMRYCGSTLDLHGGGVDLVFPHHENELAQSQAATGQPFVNHWLHHGMVNLGGEKMSKSTGLYFLAADIFAQTDPAVVRYYLSTTHFRSPIEFSKERLAEAQTAWTKLCHFVQQAARDEAGSPAIDARLAVLEDEFHAAMDDDFNSAKALGVIFECVRDLNRLTGGGAAPRNIAAKLADLMGLLGLELPEAAAEVPEAALELLAARNAARGEKDWARADAFRDQLKSLGFVIEDRAEGSVLKPI